MEITKTCSRCKESKSTELFSPNKRCRDGFTSWCLECHRKYNKKHYIDNADRCKQWREANRFLFSLIQSKKTAKRKGYIPCIASVEELSAAFNSHCEVCGVKENGKKLHMDHDHKTGKFRGWLCNRCNMILGHALDSRIHLLGLIEYLDKQGTAS